MNILYVVADKPHEWNSSEWRCMIPARAVARIPGHASASIDLATFARSAEQYTQEMSAVATADVIFIQRMLVDDDVMRAAKYWMGTGRAVLLDLDDDYLGLPAGNAASRYWYDNDGVNIKALMRNVKQVTALTSPNRLILEKWKQQGVERTVLLPNYAEGAWYEGLVKQPHDGFWVGWGGSHSHYDTWFRSGCAEGLKLACAKLPDMKVVLWGSDRRVAEMIDVPPERKEWRGAIPPGEAFKGRWPKELAQFDVALAPLGGMYDQHRSWIHVLESMLAKVPFICSLGVPYAELGKWGAEVEDAPETWCQAIVDAHDNYETCREQAAEAYKQAVQLTMQARAVDYMDEMRRLLEYKYVDMGVKMAGLLVVD